MMVLQHVKSLVVVVGAMLLFSSMGLAQRQITGTITDADNARSIALLHRLGFREEGTIQLPDQPDVLQYFLLDSAGR